MYPDKPSNNGMVAKGNVSGQRRSIGHDHVITHMTIMRHMDISHQKIMMSKRGHTTPECCPSVDGDIFTQDIVIPDNNTRRFIPILEVLWRGTDRNKGKKLASLTNFCKPVKGHVGM